MMKKSLLAILALVIGCQAIVQEQESLEDKLIYHRAFEVALWAMPAKSP